MLGKYVFLSVIMIVILSLFACSPGPKTAIGVGRGEFHLIPLVAFIAMLVVVLLFPPTRGGRRRGLLRRWLIVGVVFTGLYTLWFTLANVFDYVYLENLIFQVLIPGLALYGIMVVVVIISRKKGL
ncbi:hypothetical protein ACFLS8_03090 [Chloroflexota bacterium]